MTAKLAKLLPGVVKCLPCYNNKLSGNPSALKGWVCTAETGWE